MGPDGVLHLDLFFAALLLIKLGSESTEVLRILGDMVLLSGGALADASVMVESFAVQLLPALDVFVLRHDW